MARPERFIEYEGKSMTIREVMEITGLTYKQVYRQYVTNKKKGKNKPEPVKPAEKKPDIPQDIVDNAKAENLLPLEYMLRVMNDPTESKEMRARMAKESAPYCHEKKGAAGSGGKKEELERKAKEAGKGKFSAGKAPKIAGRIGK